MKKARTRVLAAGAITALCLSPLAACGGSEGKSDSTSDAKPSAGATADGELTKADFAETVSAAMVAKKSGHMTMEMVSMKGEGDFRYDGKNTVMQMSMSQGADQMKIVLAGGAMYMQGEGVSPPGKWMKIDKDTPMLGEMLAQMGNVSPAQQVESMKKGMKSVEFVRDTEIEGTAVREYEVTVDPKVAIEGTGVPATDLPETVSYTMFLTEDDLLRRMEMKLDGQSIKMDMTDWGKAVDVQVPPAADVVPFELPTMDAPQPPQQ